MILNRYYELYEHQSYVILKISNLPVQQRNTKIAKISPRFAFIKKHILVFKRNYQDLAIGKAN